MSDAEAISSISPSCQFRSFDHKDNRSPITEEEKNACSSFQPLFPCKPDDRSGANDDASKNLAVSIEEVYQKGFQNGLKQGSEEAYALSRSSLRPSLTTFLHNFNDLVEYSRMLEDRTSADAINLAMGIVERILGSSTSVAALDMRDLKDTMKNVMAKINRLILYMHPEDLDELHGISKEEGLDWLDLSDSIIKPDDSLQKGELRIEEQPDQRQVIDDQAIAKLAEILA